VTTHSKILNTQHFGTWTTVAGGFGNTTVPMQDRTYLIIVFPYGIPHSLTPSQVSDKGEMYVVDALDRQTAFDKVRSTVGNRPMFIMEGDVS
jgi:hypothetical protein